MIGQNRHYQDFFHEIEKNITYRENRCSPRCSYYYTRGIISGSVTDFCGLFGKALETENEIMKRCSDCIDYFEMCDF